MRLVNGPLPPGLIRWMVIISPGRTRVFQARESAGGVVFVHVGDIELESLDGRRYRFGSGAIMHLDRLPLRRIRNDGAGRAVLVAVGRVSRRHRGSMISTSWRRHMSQRPRRKW
ncbi:MAG: hypothetical protein ACRDWS_14190 [Acidimicrobiia bacterium]